MRIWEERARRSATTVPSSPCLMSSRRENLLNPSVKDKANSFINRGIAYDKSGEKERAIADYSTVITMPDAPAEAKARAHLVRGAVRAEIGEREAAIADFSAIIAMPDAPPNVRTKAENCRRQTADGLAVGKPGGSQNKPKAHCFIATVCYGSPDALQVLELRRFRDEVLLRTVIGSWLVSVYYCVSPSIAKWLKRHQGANIVIRRFLLDPIVRSISK